MEETNLSISNSEIRDARRLLVKALLFFPLLLLVLAVNIQIDPEGLYRKAADKQKRDEYHIAQALAAGRDVKAPRPIDDRLLQKYFVENLGLAPDIVVLGSSHSVWLGNNIFPGKKVINNSVSAAVLADYLGIFEGYAKRKLFPQRVILVLDPSLILSPVISERWLSIDEDTRGMLERLGVRSEWFKKPVIPQAWLNIFSFSYFQRSMEKLQDRIHPLNHLNNEDIDGGPLFFKDGRRLWDNKFRSRHTENNRGLTSREIYYGPYLEAIREHTRPLGNKMKQDKELEDILEKFIRYLRGNHIQVTLCLLPVHPQLYQFLLEPQKVPGGLDIVSIEHFYKGLAKKLNLEITGSYDPAVCGLVGKDFYDEEHIRNNVIERILKEKNSQCSMPEL